MMIGSVRRIRYAPRGGSWRAPRHLPGTVVVPLVPVVIEPRYSRQRRAGGRRHSPHLPPHPPLRQPAIYAGTGKLELEFFQLYEVSLSARISTVTGEARAAQPRHLPPGLHRAITFRLNYLSQRALNDLTSSPAPAWAQENYEAWSSAQPLERRLHHKLKASYAWAGERRPLVDPAHPRHRAELHAASGRARNRAARLPLKDAAPCFSCSATASSASSATATARAARSISTSPPVPSGCSAPSCISTATSVPEGDLPRAAVHAHRAAGGPPLSDLQYLDTWSGSSVHL